jgi:hypothetical protein
MSDLLTIYSSNLQLCLNKITNLLAQTPSNEVISSLRSCIIEGEKIIKQMQIESASLPNKEDFIQVINAYNIELTQHKRSLRMFEENLKQDASYNKLFKGQKTNNLIANEEYAYAGSQKLEEAKRVHASTEDTSNKIMNNMEEQTNKMKSVNVKIKGMNDSLDESNSLLTIMQKRILKNKKIVILSAIIIITILVLTIVLKLLYKKRK